MSDRIVLVTASTDEPLSVSDVKLWLKIEEEETAEDDLLAGLIATARQRYEQYTKRIPLKQTFDFYQDCPPYEAIVPPYFPLSSVTSIKGFTDTDATDTGGTSMSSSGYYVDTASEPGRIVPFSGFTFPTATRVVNGTITRFIAGHSTSSTGVPEHVKTTLKNMIAKAVEFRGDLDPAAAMDDYLFNEFSVPEWG